MTGAPTVDTAGTMSRDAAPARYSVGLARGPEEVRAAQRLRYEVFVEEMGARLATPVAGHDVDRFDAYCDHLVVRDEVSARVVATYRLLPPERASLAGSLYSESEFDLRPLAAVRPDLVEVGRSCVHPDHRDGAVIGLIWAGVARYMTERGHEWLAGCCSLPLSDGGVRAAATWERVRRRHLAPEAYRVRPLLPWTPRPELPTADAPLPPLLRGYLRLGAWVCGEPAHDPEFGVADLYVLLRMSRVDRRYLRHFLAAAPA
jgi:putative hemolysin